MRLDWIDRALFVLAIILLIPLGVHLVGIVAGFVRDIIEFGL